LLLVKCSSALQSVIDAYASPFDVGGTHAIFYENVAQDVLVPEGPTGAMAWDNLWAAASAAVAGITQHLSAAGASRKEATLDGVLSMPWLDMEEILGAEPEVMKVGHIDTQSMQMVTAAIKF
jgi:hypothetical protein